MGKTKHSRSFKQKLIQATGYKGLRRAERAERKPGWSRIGSHTESPPPELEKQEGRKEAGPPRAQVARPLRPPPRTARSREPGENTGSR